MNVRFMAGFITMLHASDRPGVYTARDSACVIRETHSAPLQAASEARTVRPHCMLTGGQQAVQDHHVCPVV